MKYLFLGIISVYQQFFSLFLKSFVGTTNVCRFSPTCSVYAKEVIKKQGVYKGGMLALLRLLSCQPFFTLGSTRMLGSQTIQQ